MMISISWDGLILTKEKQTHKKNMLTTENTPFNTPFCSNLGPEASTIYSWPIPFSVYSKIVSIETKTHHTIRKWQGIFFRNRKCEMSFWNNEILLNLDLEFLPSTRSIFLQCTTFIIHLLKLGGNDSRKTKHCH